MFVLIPLVIVFLSLSYIYVNDNLSIYTQIGLYILMITVSIISIVIYKKIKYNMKEQDNNQIRLEILELEKKLKTSTDKTLLNSIKQKIKQREKEIL
ncbi:MAG: hypothetical protein U9Q20_01920 [Campylobacterota bacterium]|nr:hypothetical protein [Campylobacterota bacterium]